MNEDVQEVQPEDFEIAEAWLRETDESEIRNVEACRIERIGAWQVSVWVMEFIDSDPLETELRERITGASRCGNEGQAVGAMDIELPQITPSQVLLRCARRSPAHGLTRTFGTCPVRPCLRRSR